MQLQQNANSSNQQIQKQNQILNAKLQEIEKKNLADNSCINSIYYEETINKISILVDFFGSHPQYLPITLDFREYGQDDLLDPINQLYQLVEQTPYSILSYLVQYSVTGLNWISTDYITALKNLVKLGTTENITLIFLYICSHLLVLKFFFGGSACKVAVYEKSLNKFIENIHFYDKEIQVQLFEIINIIFQKLQKHIDVKKYEEQLQQLSDTLDLSVDDKKIEAEISNGDWIKLQQLVANQSQNNQIDNKSKDQQSVQQQQDINLNYRGLQNMGNTCYMNSYTQALFMTKEFRFRLFKIKLKDIFKNHNISQSTPNLSSNTMEEEKEQQAQLASKSASENQGKLQQLEKQRNFATVFQLQKLFTLLYQSKRSFVNPQNFKNILPEMFRFSSAQHDATEYGRMFLEQLEISLKNTDDNVRNQFEQIHSFQANSNTAITVPTKEQAEQEQKQKQEQEELLKKQISDYNQNVEDLIRESFRDEEFSGDNMYFCSFCNKKSENAVKKMTLSSLPNYVILTINRFQFDRKLLKKVKLMYKVQLLECINMSNYINDEYYSQENEQISQKNIKKEIIEEEQQQKEDKIISENEIYKEPLSKNQKNNEIGNSICTQDQKNNDLNLQQSQDKKLQDITQQSSIDKMEEEIVKDIEKEKNQNKNKNQNYDFNYQLYAIVVHKGKSAEHGHYYTFSRENSSETTRWVKFDDSHISYKNSFEEIQDFFKENQDDTPYLLFYQKKEIAQKFDEIEKKSEFKLGNTLLTLLQNDNDLYMKEMENNSKTMNALNKFRFNLPKSNYNQHNKRNNDDDDEDYQDSFNTNNNREIF